MCDRKLEAQGEDGVEGTDEMYMYIQTSREKKPKPDPVLRTMPTRRTRRAAGDEPADKENDPQQAPAKELEDPVALMTLSEYYEKNGIVPGPLMDGHFKGWVKEETCVRLGMARNAADAWEANGGGSFSRKLPPGVSAKVCVVD
jgi:hypothetical protein